MMHHGVSGVRYDSVNRELRISRSFAMDINNVPQINDYLRFSYTFVLPPGAEVLGRGEISVMDGFVNSVSLSLVGGNIHLTLNTARVLAFSIYEEPNYFVIRARLPRDVSPFIVVIDPGHGGSDPGARHNGVVEKDMVLTVSHKVMQLLDSDPSVTAFMTRRDDTFVSLLNRTEFANNLGADLFVSIHANAAEFSPGVINPYVHGIETWYTVGELERVGSHRTDSRQLAGVLQRHMIQATGANDRGLKDAPNFVVLQETKMPAVLLELGFLTNPYEAARLANAQHQWQLANAIYLGIIEAFLTHPPVPNFFV
jgi:N-acetylmuramoyl-L-alanine amidase